MPIWLAELQFGLGFLFATVVYSYRSIYLTTPINLRTTVIFVQPGQDSKTNEDLLLE